MLILSAKIATETVRKSNFLLAWLWHSWPSISVFVKVFLIIHDVKTWIRVSKTKISRNAYQSYAKRLNLDCSYFPQCWGRHSNVDKIEHCNVYKHVPIHLRRKAQYFLHHCFLLRTPTKFWSRMQLRHVWPQKWK